MRLKEDEGGKALSSVPTMHVHSLYHQWPSMVKSPNFPQVARIFREIPQSYMKWVVMGVWGETLNAKDAILLSCKIKEFVV